MKEFLQELGLLLYKYDGSVVATDADSLVLYTDIANKANFLRVIELNPEDIQELLREWED